jgi:uncharacterized protein YndB with AHSA1/START domain
MTRVLAAGLLLFLLAAPVAADVVGAGENGFSVKVTTAVNATPATVFRALTAQVGRWWDPTHTFSGNAANLTIEPRAGGCFCERLPNGGVQHMLVTHVNAPATLVLQGGLGPLGTMGVAGAMEWTLNEGNSRTALQLVYGVGGYAPGGFVQLAAVVNGVLNAQVMRLKAFVETGRPE